MCEENNCLSCSSNDSRSKDFPGRILRETSQHVCLRKDLYLFVSISLSRRAKFHGAEILFYRVRFASPISAAGKIAKTDSYDMRYSGLQKIHAISALYIRGLDLFLE